MFGAILPWLGLHSTAGLANSIFFTLCTVLTLYSHARAVLTDPGSPSSNPEMKNLMENGHSDEMEKGSRLKYCAVCSCEKPMRSHHCSRCGRCVLRQVCPSFGCLFSLCSNDHLHSRKSQDHHCMWIGNCVGFRNYKYFFLLLFWGTVVTMYFVVLVVWRMTAYLTAGKKPRGLLFCSSRSFVRSFCVHVCVFALSCVMPALQIRPKRCLRCWSCGCG